MRKKNRLPNFRNPPLNFHRRRRPTDGFTLTDRRRVIEFEITPSTFMWQSFRKPSRFNLKRSRELENWNFKNTTSTKKSKVECSLSLRILFTINATFAKRIYNNRAQKEVTSYPHHFLDLDARVKLLKFAFFPFIRWPRGRREAKPHQTEFHFRLPP